MNYYILGLSCFYNDSAIALTKNEKIVVAVKEERFSRSQKNHNIDLTRIFLNYGSIF